MFKLKKKPGKKKWRLVRPITQQSAVSLSPHNTAVPLSPHNTAVIITS